MQELGILWTYKQAESLDITPSAHTLSSGCGVKQTYRKVPRVLTPFLINTRDEILEGAATASLLALM